MSETPGFESSIRPLFRNVDQQSMASVFDLWSYEDVRDNCDGILQRLEVGDMSCDRSWSPEQVALFKDWMASGMAP